MENQNTSISHGNNPTRIILALYHNGNLDYDQIHQHTKIDKIQLAKYIKINIVNKGLAIKTTLNGKKTVILTKKGQEEAQKIQEKINETQQILNQKNAREEQFQTDIERVKAWVESQEDLLNVLAMHNSLTWEIDFQQIISFDPELGNMILDRPNDMITLLRGIVRNKYSTYNDLSFNPYIKFRNLTKTSRLPIRRVGVQYLDKLHTFEGNIKYISENKPFTKEITWNCQACEHSWIERLKEDNIIKPRRCYGPNCMAKGGFYITDKVEYNRNYLLLETPMENRINSNPEVLLCVIEKELTQEKSFKNISAGKKALITGILQRKYKYKYGQMKTEFDIICKVSNIDIIDDDFIDLNLTKEEQIKIESIFDLMNTNFTQGFNLLTKNYAGYLIHMDVVKEASMLQLVAGRNEYDNDEVSMRNKIHLLLVGEPGTGKTELANFAAMMIPNAKKAVGVSSSGVGITAAVRKEPELGVNVLEAGKVVLAHNSICVVDEFDKMGGDDQNMLLQAMENGKIDVDKAGISVKMTAETGILCLANPVGGDFDDHTHFLNQIDLPPPIRQRFDLIFKIADSNTEEEDELIADAMLNRSLRSSFTDGFSVPFLQKFFNYVKMLQEPRLTEAAVNQITSYYKRLRKAARGGSKRVSTVGKRIANTYQRLAKSYARFRGSEVVQAVDVDRAHWMVVQGYDWAFNKDGSLDETIIYSTKSLEEVGKWEKMRGVLVELDEQLVGQPIPDRLIFDVMKDKFSVLDIELFIDKCLKDGLVTDKIKTNHYKLIK